MYPAMSTAWLENVQLKRQQQILQMRATRLKHFTTKAELDNLDAVTIKELREICEAKLAPVVLESKKHGRLAGHLMQRVGAVSYRVLIPLETWQIVRVKLKDACIRSVPDNAAFRKALDVQRESRMLVDMLFSHGDNHALPIPKKPARLKGQKVSK